MKRGRNDPPAKAPAPGIEGAGSRVALDGLTVIIPIRVDTPDRARNLRIVLEYFRRHFVSCKLLVIEHGAEPKAAEFMNGGDGGDYFFMRAEGCFHKSRVFNRGIALADTPFVLLYDTDVVFRPQAIAEAYEMLANGGADFIYPYNEVMLQIRKEDLDEENVVTREYLDALPVCEVGGQSGLPASVEYLYGDETWACAGGALMGDRRKLILAGGYNENIISYGGEDVELQSRLEKLEARMARLPGYNCYHLEHMRGPDSHYNGFHSGNAAEWEKVRNMEKADLARYVENGFRKLSLDTRRELVRVDTPTEYSLSLKENGKTELADVSLVIFVDETLGAFENLIVGFLDGIESRFSNYECFLVEAGSYAWKPLSHRDHVIYLHCPETGNSRWLPLAVERATRPVIGVCDPSVELDPARLEEVLRQVREDPRAPALIERCKTGASPEAAAQKQDRVAQMVARRLPTRGRSVFFDREQFVRAWHEGCQPDSVDGDLADVVRGVFAGDGEREVDSAL